MCCQESELGEHLVRRVPVHRLLRDPPLAGRAPQLHQVGLGGAETADAAAVLGSAFVSWELWFNSVKNE